MHPWTTCNHMSDQLWTAVGMAKGKKEINNKIKVTQ